MDPIQEMRIVLWKSMRDETLQYMRMLDFWIMFILAVFLVAIWASRQSGFREAIVFAAIWGACGTVWIGRLDVLIHRNVPAIVDIENEFGFTRETTSQGGRAVPNFRSWENWYKPNLRFGVKILVPLDALALIAMFVLLIYANRHAYIYLASDPGTTSWATPLWMGCWLVFALGVGFIAAAKKLAE